MSAWLCHEFQRLIVLLSIDSAWGRRLFVRIHCDRPKEAIMGGHRFPEIPCTIFAKPVDLETDLTADENGKAVHEQCYVASASRVHTAIRQSL
jgi:hypothetical protein